MLVQHLICKFSWSASSAQSHPYTIVSIFALGPDSHHSLPSQTFPLCLKVKRSRSFFNKSASEDNPFPTVLSNQEYSLSPHILKGEIWDWCSPSSIVSLLHLVLAKRPLRDTVSFPGHSIFTLSKTPFVWGSCHSVDIYAIPTYWYRILRTGSLFLLPWKQSPWIPEFCHPSYEGIAGKVSKQGLRFPDAFASS